MTWTVSPGLTCRGSEGSSTDTSLSTSRLGRFPHIAKTAVVEGASQSPYENMSSTSVDLNFHGTAGGGSMFCGRQCISHFSMSSSLILTQGSCTSQNGGNRGMIATYIALTARLAVTNKKAKKKGHRADVRHLIYSFGKSFFLCPRSSHLGSP